MQFKFMKINKLKLATILATCMVAAMIVCCTNFCTEHHKDFREDLEKAERQQFLVRRYVSDKIEKVGYVDDAEWRIRNFMFAKLVLNAYDIPYERVIDALKNHQDDIDRAEGNKEKLLKSTHQVVAEAYRDALKESQKYSVMILTELQRNQEKIPNEQGRRSHLHESLNQWQLEKLADFESHLLDTYLASALHLEKRAQ